jgi:hypothetical protein
MKKRLFQLLVFFLFFNSFTYAQEAQTSTYTGGVLTMSPSANTYTPLVGGTTILSISTDDAIAQNIPIGFTFKLNCNTFTTVSVSSNGFLGLAGTFLTNSTNTNASSPLSSGNTLIAPLWDDLNGSAGTASYLTTGTAPNRIFTVEWKNWKWYYNSTTANISFQVKLYEDSGKVEFIYNPITTPEGTPSASIGYFNGLNVTTRQLWLNDFGSNPSTSTTIVNTIANNPANGQKYTLINPNDCNISCYGTMTINSAGGQNSSDGLLISLSGGGNMHIKKNNIGQIYPGSLYVPNGTSTPFATNARQGLVLKIGNQYFKTGTYGPDNVTDSGNFNIDFNTCQSDIQDTGNSNHYTSKISLSKVVSGRNYLLNIYYDYTAPNTYFNIKYEVVIPSGHPAGTDVVLTHAWDTYLLGVDQGPGFVQGTAPYLTVGVVKSPSYEAFKYISGTPWAGYYSAAYSSFNIDLSGDNIFNNTINTNASTDNGIGISMNFGSTPGTYNSISNVIFACNVPTTAPTLSTNSLNATCPGNKANLSSVVTTTLPAGTSLEWINASTNAVVTNTSSVSPGVYYAVIKDYSNGCESSASSNLTVVSSACCQAGTVAPTVN